MDEPDTEYHSFSSGSDGRQLRSSSYTSVRLDSYEWSEGRGSYGASGHIAYGSNGIEYGRNSCSESKEEDAALYSPSSGRQWLAGLHNFLFSSIILTCLPCSFRKVQQRVNNKQHGDIHLSFLWVCLNIYVDSWSGGS